MSQIDIEITQDVSQTLGQLSGQARHLVRVASVIDGDISVPEIARLMSRSTAAMLPAIEEALASGLIRETGTGLRFRHEALRDAVRRSLPASLAAALRDDYVRLRPAPPSPGWETLSRREQEIARLVGCALTNRQIATRIGRSPHTVNYHLRQIFGKLHIGSRVELASWVHNRAAIRR